MMKEALILVLILGISASAYSQEDSFNDSLPHWDSPWEQQLRWNRFLNKPGENEVPNVRLGEAQRIDILDPGMPVAVPSQDDVQFPIKVIPEDFPSNMPIAKLPDTSPFKEADKPTVRVVPRNRVPHP